MQDNDIKQASQDTPLIFDTSDGQQLRINTVNTYLRKKLKLLMN